MIIYYVIFFCLSFLITLILVPFIRDQALQRKVIDQPKPGSRKIHLTATPLLGGTAIFLTVFFLVFWARVFNFFDFSRIPDHLLGAIFLAGLLIMVGGFLDDKYHLKPAQQIIWPIAAVVLVLAAGLKITYITNPLGDLQRLIIYLPPAIGIILSFIWLMLMMYTTKLLDGLDGLATGIAAIASLMIFFASLDWDVPMSATSAWALILLGSSLGFLVFNWHPAKIFLGEGGSIFLGFMLGVLSIISGSKIATTLLVVGVPVLDVFWVVVQRFFQRQSPFTHADRKHLHFRLLDLGFSHRGSVLFLYWLALAFGAVGIFSFSFGKFIGLIVLALLMLILSIIIYLNNRRRHANHSNY